MAATRSAAAGGRVIHVRMIACTADLPGAFGSDEGAHLCQVEADASLYLWMERSVTPGWGLFGGEAGEGPRMHIAGSQDRHDLKANRLPLRAGDTVVMETGGGGGWGDPFERDPEAVLRDVADGFVSRERAAERYGVAITGTPPAVDRDATRKLRAS